MFSGLFTAPLTIADLFSDPFRFAIPPYQRRFSWTVKEAGQLLDDIVLAAGSDPEETAEQDYFLGAILLTDASDGADWSRGLPRTPRKLDIVDGQQRLTTLAILLAALRDLAAEEGDRSADQVAEMLLVPAGGRNRALRLRLDGGDGVILTGSVLNGQGEERQIQSQELSAGAQAILDVRDHFLNELASLPLGDRRRLFAYVRDKCYVVAIVTTDIDHGHRMFTVLNDRGRPLARKDIIKAEVLIGLPPNRVEALLEAWDSIERRVGADLDAFFSHMRVIRGKGKLPIIAGIRAARAEAGGSEPFVFDVMLPLVEAYEIISHARHQGSPQSAEINRRLRYLSWLGSTEWVPPTMQWLSLHRADPGLILQFLAIIESFAFSLRLMCIGTGKRASRFSGVLSAIADGSVLDPARSPCALTSDEQRHITYNLRNLHERHPQTCKLVLLRLNDEFEGSAQNLDPQEWTVEHILPQNPGRGSQWRAWFPDVDEREQLTRSLGNLVLVRRSQNDKASNQDFARKKAIFFKQSDADVPAITREIKTVETWTPAVIRAREERFLRILSEIWRLDLSAMQSAGLDRGFPARRRRHPPRGSGQAEQPEVTEV